LVAATMRTSTDLPVLLPTRRMARC